MDLLDLPSDLRDLIYGLLFGDPKNALLVFLRSKAFNTLFLLFTGAFLRWPWKAWRRWRRNRTNSRILESLRKSSFVFGNVKERVFVADFCIGGYRPENIKTYMVDVAQVPPRAGCEILARRSHDKWMRLVDENKLTNNTNLRLSDFHITREGDREKHQIMLSFALVTYVETRVAADVWLQCLSEQQRMDVLLNGRQVADPYFSKFFGMTLAVLLEGNEVLVLKRSEAMRVAPGKFAFGVSESMSFKDIPSTRLGLPDMYKMARRGLMEECGIILLDDEVGRIRITSMILDEFPYEWQMTGYVDLRAKQGIGEDPRKSAWWSGLAFWKRGRISLPAEERFSLATIKKGIANGRAPDRYEHDGVSSVPFNAKAIAKLMDEREFLHPHIVNIILTLLATGERASKLEDAFTRYYKSREKFIPMPG